MAIIHLTYVIAKINGRYRCLSVLLHLYCAPTAALHNLSNNQIPLFQCLGNRTNLQHELEYAQTLPETFWDPKPVKESPDESDDDGQPRMHVPDRPDTPFPFISTCHILSTTIEPDYVGPQESICAIGDFRSTEPGRWLDDSGITVIDITTPSRVAYCFASAKGVLNHGYTAHSAAEYSHTLQDYFRRDDNDIRLDLQSLAHLAKCPLIDVAALKQTWPHTDWKQTNKGECYTMAAQKSLLAQVQHTDLIGLSKAPTLWALAFRRLLNDIFQIDAEDDLSWLKDAEELPRFLPEVRKTLYQNPNVIGRSSNAFNLLAKVVADDKELDLSPFNNMRGTQLCRLLDGHKCTSLDLASMVCVTRDILEEVLTKTPNLESLNVLGTPNLPLDDLGAAITGSKNMIKDVSHSQLFSKYLGYMIGPGSRLADVTQSSDPALRFGHVSPVVQLLYVNTARCLKRQRLANGGVPLTRIVHQWRRPEICSVPLYLGESFLPVEKLTTGILNLIDFLKVDDQIDNAKVCRAAAKAFGLAGTWKSSAVEGCQRSWQQDLSVSPMAALAHVRGKYGSRPYGHVNPPATLTPKPGQWTVIIVDERHDDMDKIESLPTETRPLGLRYAFVTSAQGLDNWCGRKPRKVNMTIPKPTRPPLSQESVEYKDSIIVADIDKFLLTTMADVEDAKDLMFEWEMRMSRIEKMVRNWKNGLERAPGAPPRVVNETSLCSHDEVEEVLRFFLDAQDPCKAKLKRGDPRDVSGDEDIEHVMSAYKMSREKAIEALKKHGGYCIEIFVYNMRVFGTATQSRRKKRNGAGKATAKKPAEKTAKGWVYLSDGHEDEVHDGEAGEEELGRGKRQRTGPVKYGK